MTMTTIYLMRHSKTLKINNEFNTDSLQVQNEKNILSIEGEHIAQDRFNNKEYEWALLKLNDHSLELFQSDNKSLNHIAYSYNREEEINMIIKELGYKKIEAFYGDLNRKSFFIEDNNGNQIQLIKK